MWQWLATRIAAGVAFFSLLIGSMHFAHSVFGAASSPLEMVLNVQITTGEKACWHSICPGTTTFLDARTHLQSDKILDTQDSKVNLCGKSRMGIGADRPIEGCMPKLLFDNVAGDSDPVMMIDLQIPPDLIRLGDVVWFLGKPVGVFCLTPARNALRLSFKGDIFVQVVPHRNGSLWYLSPDLPISALYFGMDHPLIENVMSHGSSFRNFYGSGWKGFTTIQCS